MGVTVAVTRVACNVSTGNQDITTADLGGLTPKAALFICTGATSDGTAADNANLSIGAATGASNECCVSINCEHGQDIGDTYSTTDSDRCVRINVPGENTVDGEAEFSSLITNGGRVNWLDAPASAYLLASVFFAGTDVEAHCGHVALGDSVDNAVDVTDPGFEPDVVIAWCMNSLGMDSGTGTAMLSIGLVHNDGEGGVIQNNQFFYYADGLDTSGAYRIMSETYGVMRYTAAAGGTLDWGGEFSDFDADGFTVTTRNAGANNTSLMYLALKFSGVESWVGKHTTPTSTGNDSETGPSFTPQFVLLIESLIEAVDTFYYDSRAGSFGIGVFDGDDEYTTIITDEDGVDVSNTQSLSDARAIVVPDDDGTLDIEASFVSFDANGWTVNYTNAPAAAKLFLALAIEAEAAGPTYTLTAEDAISVGESVAISVYTPSADLEIGKSDSITVSESLVITIGDLTVSELDAAAISESVSVTIGDLVVSESDAVAVGEAIIVTISDVAISESDGVTVSDSQALAVGDLVVSESDGVTVGEYVELSLPELGAISVGESDAITVSDSATLAMADMEIGRTDGMVVDDDPTVGISGVDLAIAVVTSDEDYWLPGIRIVTP